MRIRRTAGAAALAAVALTLTACGSDAGDSGSDSTGSGSAAAGRPEDRHQVRPAGPRAQEGVRVLRVRRRRRDLRGQGARHGCRRHHLGAGPERPAREPHRQRPGRHGRRDVLHHRHPQGEGLVRRAVLHRRPGPPRARRRHLDHRPRQPRGQEALLGHRLDLGAEGQGHLPGRAAAGVRDVLRVPSRAGQQGRRRPDHRRHDPRRLRRRSTSTRASSRSSASRSPRRSTASASRRATPPPARRSTRRSAR